MFFQAYTTTCLEPNAAALGAIRVILPDSDLLEYEARAFPFLPPSYGS